MYNENTIIRTCVIDIGGLLNIDDNGPFFLYGVHNDEPKSSHASMNWTLFRLQDVIKDTKIHNNKG